MRAGRVQILATTFALLAALAGPLTGTAAGDERAWSEATTTYENRPEVGSSYEAPNPLRVVAGRLHLHRPRSQSEHLAVIGARL